MRHHAIAAVGMSLVVGVALAVGSATASQAATTCSGASSGDINGDGYPDTVITDPAATVDGHPGAGIVQVRYGGPKAPSPTRLTQDNTGGAAEKNDHFGASVTFGLVDGDHCSDIVIGAPGENRPGATDAGVVHVVFGSPSGAGKVTASLVLAPGTLGLPGKAAVRADFGAAVALSSSEEGSGRLLAIGAPGAGSGAGAVWLVEVHADGSVAGSHTVTEATTGVPGTRRSGNRFGAALDFGYLGHVQRAGYIADLLVGAPGENKSAGAAVMIADVGAPAPYTGKRFTQATAGVGDSPEPGDGFGTAIDVYLNGFTGERYVAIGAPGEDLGSVKDTGIVHLFATGSTMTGAAETTISQNTSGVADRAEAGDHFGASVRVMPYWTGAGTSFGVVVGAPGEDVGSVQNAGGIAFFPFHTGSPGASDRWITQNTAGVPGKSQQGDHFGAAVSSSPLGGILVGVPDDVAHPSGAVQHLPWEVVLGQSAKGAKTWGLSGGARFGAVIG